MPINKKMRRLKKRYLKSPLTVNIGKHRWLVFGKNELREIVGFLESSQSTLIQEKYLDFSFWENLVTGDFRTADTIRLVAVPTGTSVHTQKKIFKITQVIETRFCAGKCENGKGKGKWYSENLRCTCKTKPAIEKAV